MEEEIFSTWKSNVDYEELERLMICVEKFLLEMRIELITYRRSVIIQVELFNHRNDDYLLTRELVESADSKAFDRWL